MSAEARFIERQFRRFYIENASKIKPPRALQQREFGFTIPEKGGMIRHLGFQSTGGLHTFLQENAPTNSYYSSALYREPNAPDMPLKGWLGADLAFDIDADHIETPCKAEHDTWLCADCKEMGAGPAPERCPKCNSRKLEEETWLCRDCLGAAKREAIILIHEYLVDELGFLISDMDIRFSGHRGYHILVANEKTVRLGQDARREITDYVRGVGVVPERVGFRRPKAFFEGPDLNEEGWQGRIARGVLGLLREHGETRDSAVPLGKTDLEFIASKRDEILADLEKKPPEWHWMTKLTKHGRSFLIETAATREASKVDPLVTQDIHRLMRLPGSLHGKTGFIVKPLTLQELEEFDPWSDAVAFGNGELSIHAREVPETRMDDGGFGPFDDEDVVVPFALGVYLLAKKKAFFKKP